MQKLVKFLPAVTLLAPVFVLAQFGELNTFFLNIITFINNIIVPLLFAVAAVVFFWGVFQYFILGGGSDDNKEKGKALMLWGIGGFVLMVSLWGIVNLIAGGLDLDKQNIQNIPNLPTKNN